MGSPYASVRLCSGAPGHSSASDRLRNELEFPLALDYLKITLDNLMKKRDSGVHYELGVF